MIVIAGNTHDDILYFDTVLANKKEDVLLNRFKVSIGTIFNQEVLVVHECTSSVLASALMTYILGQYYVDLVIVVGRCISIDKDVRNGDIIVSKQIIDCNIDLSTQGDTILGQYPGMPREFVVQQDILEYLLKGLRRRSFVPSHVLNVLTTDNMASEQVEYLKKNHSLFGIKDEFVLDNNSSGVALACTLKSVPCITIKVAENKIEQTSNIDTYLNVLTRYVDLGKAVVSTINDIGRNDILEGNKLR